MKELVKVITEVTTWTKRVISLAVLAMIAVVVLKMFGVSVPMLRVSVPGYQELGVFVAGVAFAMSKL